MKFVKVVFLVVFLITIVPAYSMVPIGNADLNEKTGIAPAFFGPNAFPVPEMSTGILPSGVSVDLGAECFDGFICPGAEDRTKDMFINLHIPLCRNRVAISLWYVPHEWYSMDKKVMDARRIQEDNGQRDVDGDISVVLEILLLKERKYLPSFTLRSVLKSASGEEFGRARYYDCPGYFFDLTASKSVFSSEYGFFRDLRLGAAGGFLCWQTDNGRQNDAFQYGVFVDARTTAFNVYAQFAGYNGWEKYGDRPMTLTARINIGPDWMVSPFIQFQHGFRDWPFNQYRFGLSFDISKAFKGIKK